MRLIFRTVGRPTRWWDPRVGILPGELSLAEVRSSISTSLLGSAEESFLYEVGMAQVVKPGYQTTKILVGRDSLRPTGVPNTSLVSLLAAPLYYTLLSSLSSSILSARRVNCKKPSQFGATSPKTTNFHFFHK